MTNTPTDPIALINQIVHQNEACRNVIVTGYPIFKEGTTEWDVSLDIDSAGVDPAIWQPVIVDAIHQAKRIWAKK